MDWQERNSYVKILEQPAPKALRFRYECEGRSAGSLPGINSSGDRKTYPKIQIQNYVGRAVVVVSCVTVDPPYRPHPHNLVGKEGCKKGVCTMEINNEDMSCEFSNLGIQCVKKKDIEDSLKVREDIRVDPFRTGFGHKNQPGSIDLNSVRLCFQVFLEGPEKGQFKLPLKAVVSDPIYDKKAINDLTIMKLSDCASPVVGNKEIILLCDKVSKDDIEIRFYEEDPETGAVTWEAFGDFQPSDVHKQFAISFRTPQYHNLEIPTAARVKIQLRCPSKETTSVARPFDYIPLTSDMEIMKRKRKDNNSQKINQFFDFNSAKRQRVSSFPPPVKQEPLESYNSYLQHPNYFSGGEILQNYNFRDAMPPPLENPLSLPLPSQIAVQQQQQIQQSSSSSHHLHHHHQQQQQQHLQQQQQQQLESVAEDLGNISLPNLSDVNLSLLESHLSDNISNLNIFERNNDFDIPVSN